MSKFRKILVLILTVSLLVTALFPCGISLAYTHEFHFRSSGKTDYVGSITDVGGNAVTGVVTIQDFINWCNTNLDSYNCSLTIHAPYRVLGDETWEVEAGSSLTIINDQQDSSNYPPVVLDDSRPSRSLTLKGSIICDGNELPHWFLDIRENCTVNMYDGVVIRNAKRTDSATASATGVCLYAYATFNMYGGTITGNSVDAGGAYSTAVWCRETGCTFNMYGGTITGNDNHLDRGAVYFGGAGMFNIGGAASVDGNYGRNIYMESGKTFGIMSALTGTQKFFLEGISIGSVCAYGVNGYTLKSSDLAKISCENLPAYAYLRLDTSRNCIFVERISAIYTVEYYYQTLGGTYTLATSTGTYGAGLTYSFTPAANVNYGGYSYTYDSGNVNNVTSITISAANPALNVLKVYYKLNSVNFEVVYYYELPSGGYSASPYVAETGTGMTGNTVSRTHPDTWTYNSLSYEYDAGNAGNVSSAVLVSGTTARLCAYYKLTEVPYRVHIYFMTVNGTYGTVPDITELPLSGKNGTVVTKTPVGVSNFSVDTAKSTLSITLDADTAKNIISVYYARDKVNYTVETYLMSIDETYSSTPTSTQTLSDYVERTVTYTPAASVTSGIYKYGLDNAASTLSVTLANGTNTIKVYYAIALGNLTVTVDNASSEDQTFVFTISGAIGTFDVTVVGNNSTTITGLPVGDYTVYAKNGWSWRYTAASAENVTINMLPGLVKDNAVAVFSNGQTVWKWLSSLANGLFRG